MQKELLQSIEFCDNHYKSWFSWCFFCYSLFLIEMKFPNSNACFKLLDNCIKSIPYAINYKPQNVKVIFGMILNFLGDINYQKLFEKVIIEIPSWFWLLWIPNLITIAMKSEKHFVVFKFNITIANFYFFF
jgi:hypothetical protein